MALTALSFFFVMPRAEAHPQLKTSVPVADASTASPKEIRLIFSEGLIAKLSGLDLRDEAGILMETGVAALDSSDKRQLVVPLKSALPAGRYTVEWHVVSEDTHRVTGRFVFRVEP